jgi:N-acetylglucosamine malate deacetylase 1
MTTLDVLAIGAHPDDIELGCGGTIARLVAQGRRVGLLHLTRGENGSRGSADLREAEARAAAAALGAAFVDFLDCGDGALRSGVAEEDAVIKVLRATRPEIILAPAPQDRHPDHGRAHRLVVDACFYAGLRRRAPAPGAEPPAPHRPGAIFAYMQHDPFEPSLVVDVTEFWARKLEALACYSSQLYQKDRATNEPETKTASRAFALNVEGRARHFGQIINVELAEPFWSRQALAVSDLFAVLPGGLR